MKNAVKHIAISVIGLVFVFGLAGCKSVADKAVEKAVERTTGAEVDVDTSQNQVAVNVNGTSWAAGDAVRLPTDFPEDVYVADGTVKVAIASDETQGFTVSIESTQSVTALKSLYTTELKADGWTIAGNIDIQGSSSITATKANRTTTVSIGPNSDTTKTTVTINTYTDKTATTNAAQ